MALEVSAQISSRMGSINPHGRGTLDGRPMTSGLPARSLIVFHLTATDVETVRKISTSAAYYHCPAAMQPVLKLR